MSDKSKIEWTDATWNPVTGCTKVSEGCRNCYALTFAERFRGTPGHYFENGFDITLRPNKMLEPLKWRKAKKIFVNSMSDLFHPEVPDDFIDQVFGVILANHVLDRQAEHTFQLLTKRPERMQEYLGAGPDVLLERWGESLDGVVIMDNPDVCFSEYVDHFLDKDEFFPLPNLWIGTSVENQKAAVERIPHLLMTPADVRFLSCEPLLGSVDFWDVPSPRDGQPFEVLQPLGSDWSGINWVIAGGESGHGARPVHPDWIRSLRDQCQAAGVPFFFKQWGEWWPYPDEINKMTVNRNTKEGGKVKRFENWYFERNGKKAAGRILDGQTWDELPQ